MQSDDKKISSYKSHDAHVMIYYLLGVAVRKTLPKTDATILIKLGDFFQGICSKVVKMQNLDQLQKEIVEILCRLEMIFIPNFFDIMVHLTIHFVDETKLGGPIYCRWMFPIEHDLCK